MVNTEADVQQKEELMMDTHAEGGPGAEQNQGAPARRPAMSNVQWPVRANPDGFFSSDQIVNALLMDIRNVFKGIKSIAFFVLIVAFIGFMFALVAATQGPRP